MSGTRMSKGKKMQIDMVTGEWKSRGKATACTTRNRLEMVGQALLFAAATVIAMLLISMMLEQMNRVRAFSNVVNENLARQTQRLSEADILMYDGLRVTGADVANIAGRYLSGSSMGPDIRVVNEKKKRDSLYTQGTDVKKLRTVDSADYVPPSSAWDCAIVTNENDVIVEIKFTAVDGV